MRNRLNLSEELAEAVRSQIVDGILVPGTRLNEVHLAEELDVSRTPLREALTRLVAEGFITALPRRGFFVSDLSDQEIEALYRIRAILDPAALELAGLPDAEQLIRLEEINEEILTTRGRPDETIEADDRWHLALLSHCTNQILLDLIRQFMLRTRPFEYAYMRETANVDVVVKEHRRIAALLGQGDLKGACAALLQNMQTAVVPLLAWRAQKYSTESAKE